MNIKDFEPAGVQAARDRRGRRRAPAPRPSWGSAMLGAVCVAGMFGVLGLLYSLG